MKLNKSYTDYSKHSFTYADNNEKTGFYEQLIRSLFSYIAVSNSESITITNSGAGSTGKFSLSIKGPILNNDGSVIGHFNSNSDKDTSLSITGTALTTEVYFDKRKKEADFLSGLNNGEYAVDYAKGIIYYKTADNTNTISVTYKYALLNIEFNDVNVSVGTVEIETPSTGGQGVTTVTSAGTAVSLGSSTTTKQVTIIAEPTNTGNMYVGFTGVDSSNGPILTPGASITISIDDLSKIYVDADVSGEKVRYLWVN